jgi:protein phosphatase
MPTLTVPDPSLVSLIGAAGSGKSTLAARHFAPAEILSSDALRAAISGDAADQSASKAAFAALYAALDRRLRAGRSAVVDATNATREARRTLLVHAETAGVPAFAIVLDLAPAVVLARNAARHDRVVPEAIVRRHLAAVRRTVDDGSLEAEGFAGILVLHDPAEVDAFEIRRHPSGSA